MINYRVIKEKITEKKKVIQNKQNIDRLFRENPNVKILGASNVKITDIEMWKKTFCNYNTYRTDEALKIAKAFVEDNVYMVKKCYKENIPTDSPILLCCVKNDLERIKMLIEHHKKIGVKHFAILDNNSEDGTYEWLLSQDIDVFRVEKKFKSVVKAGWIAKIAAYYGLNRWFLIIDSDELLVYEDMETKSIDDVINKMKEKKISRGLGLMIDMYAEISDLKSQNSKHDIFKHYRYFDTDSYEKKVGNKHIEIIGGPRDRYFGGPEESHRELLTKYPLVYWQSGELYRYHFMFPYDLNFKSPLFLGLFHYKFLDGDYEKYLQNSTSGTYALNGLLYRRYIERLGDDGCISFMNEKSCEFTKSLDLRKINVFEGMD